ncbi:MAG: DNA recombination protein RmuC [Candidatus Yanofskybacteria bacterium]|nr:DNA recombination protein RmuC [Candidatus Yanofskybacteria bacterium]
MFDIWIFMIQSLLIFIGLIAGILVALVIFKSSKHSKDDQDLQTINQRLDSFNVSMNQALRDTVKMVTDQLKDSRESVERSSLAVHQQVQGFTVGLTQLSESLKNVHESVKSVSSFQDIFKAPKLRGIWGEASLEASLAQYFPKDRYEIQHYFKSGEAVDAILRLPNELLLPIDSKFNWENFEKMINADNNIACEQYKKNFLSDVKKKIDEIASKYLLPSEGTTDFALMYVPAETVYYEIVNNIKDVDLPAYALGKKIFLVSPNTFMLSVSAIGHWLKDVQLNKQTKDIMKRLERIALDGRKLGDDFKRLGKHLSDARGSYDDSEKRLSLMVDRVQNVVELGDGKGEENLLN